IDAHPVVHHLAVEGLGHEILADALDLPGVRRAAGEHRPLRVGADDPDVGVLLLEIAGHPGYGAAGANAGHEHGHPAISLLPDLPAGSAIVDLGVGQVGELVGPPGTGNFAAQSVGDAVVTFGGIGGDVGGSDYHFGAVSLE